MRSLVVLVVAHVFLASAPALVAEVKFHFNYLDEGLGFNDPEFGGERRRALEESAGVLESIFRNYSADLFIDVDGSESGAFLATATSNYNSLRFFKPGFFDVGDVMLKIQEGNGVDPEPEASDGRVAWNFQDVEWELGDDFQGEEFDFISTATHELLHTVGFGSNIFEDGTDAFESSPGTPGVWERFDHFMADRDGVLISDDFALDRDAWAAASVGGTAAGLFFVGNHAIVANGGNPVPLYSPNEWESGSSGSHLDDEFFDGNFMMEAATFGGRSIRAISHLELAILRDIGYLDVMATNSVSRLDFNGDAKVGVADVDLLGLAIVLGGNPMGFNLTDDRIVDIQDLDFFLETARRLNGDANFDGAVNFADFLQLSANFAQTGEAIRWSKGDFDVNGAVQFPDFLILSSNFGKILQAASVPEPLSNTLYLLAAAVAMLLRRPRQKRPG